MSGEKFTCPRRVEDGRARADSPLRFDGPGLDEWRSWPDEPDRLACSYCGSMQPDALFAAIEAGLSVTPTDKSYKVYVGREKFYFQHFDEAHKMRFIMLVNEGRVVFGAPGYFYRLPYFMGQDGVTLALEIAGSVVFVLGCWLAAWIVLAQVASAILWVCGVRPKEKVHWLERVVYGNLTRIG